eukprot:CAMPEP_0206466684 /NCGR_PEP_ID=MMETSP0324_2-20121206/28601_1 /ASSEMBLY_ACC=CAM_ASM_000836 /TAXON_ID=2866 /ORGANISM="Crypthecodinium cohnii, Strain Seligo" /LENGTH=98 /DNA_ID=CAMNT_0053939839 /DNA_START=383 /DNA_END=679 /DNA_ORIENTATION=-
MIRGLSKKHQESAVEALLHLLEWEIVRIVTVGHFYLLSRKVQTADAEDRYNGPDSGKRLVCDQRDDEKGRKKGVEEDEDSTKLGKGEGKHRICDLLGV